MKGNKMAKLPNDKEGKTIEQMQVGETGYTLPWGMWVDKDKNCWLNEQYPLEKSPKGTVALKIEKLSEGYIAYIEGMVYKWNPQSEPCYVGTPQSKLYGKVLGFNNKDALEYRLGEAIKSENYEEATRIRKELGE